MVLECLVFGVKVGLLGDDVDMVSGCFELSRYTRMRC
jgi:hypothetical protein